MKDLGSGKLTLKVGQIDGEAWHQFSQQYNAQTQALLALPEIANNPELYQEKVTEAFFSALPLMLKGDPVITIAPLSWKNSQGESALNLSLSGIRQRLKKRRRRWRRKWTGQS